MDRDEESVLVPIEWTGLKVERGVFVDRVGNGVCRVTARDDDGHMQVVDAEDELSALVELAKRLGFEDMD